MEPYIEAKGVTQSMKDFIKRVSEFPCSGRSQETTFGLGQENKPGRILETKS